MGKDFFESENYAVFQKKYGIIFQSSVDGRFCYEPLDSSESYAFTNDYGIEKIEALCDKSLKDKKDYVLEIVRKNKLYADFNKGIVI